MPKRFIFLRVGISVSYQMVLHTAWKSQQTMWKCSLSDLRRVMHTPVSNTCLSREQLFNSSSKEKKTFDSSNFRKSEEEKGAGLVLCDFLCTQKTLLYLFGSKEHSKKQQHKPVMSQPKGLECLWWVFFRIKKKTHSRIPQNYKKKILIQPRKLSHTPTNFWNRKWGKTTNFYSNKKVLMALAEFP